jgi:hypothetical protein
LSSVARSSASIERRRVLLGLAEEELGHEGARRHPARSVEEPARLGEVPGAPLAEAGAQQRRQRIAALGAMYARARKAGLGRRAGHRPVSRLVRFSPSCVATER